MAIRSPGLGPASRHADVVVVGAGVIGVACAWLARRHHPELQIILLDRAEAGSGATGSSGGHLHPHGLNPQQRALSAQSKAIFDGLRRELPDLPLFDLPLIGVVDRDELDDTIAGYHGQSVRVASHEQRAELASSFPELSWGARDELIHGCTSGYGLPRALVRALIDDLRARGVQCWEGADVVGVQPHGQGVRVSLADGRTLASDRVLVAAGPQLVRGPLRRLVDGASLRIKKVVAMHLSRPVRAHDPILYLFDDDAYLIPHRHDGHWLFSFPSDEWDCRPERSRLCITARDRELAREILDRRLPGWFQSCHGGRVFCDLYTADRLPYVAPAVELPSVVVATGGSGYGFRLAPAIASRALGLAGLA